MLVDKSHVLLEGYPILDLDPLAWCFVVDITSFDAEMVPLSDLDLCVICANLCEYLMAIKREARIPRPPFDPSPESMVLVIDLNSTNAGYLIGTEFLCRLLKMTLALLKVICLQVISVWSEDWFDLVG